MKERRVMVRKPYIRVLFHHARSVALLDLLEVGSQCMPERRWGGAQY